MGKGADLFWKVGEDSGESTPTSALVGVEVRKFEKIVRLDRRKLHSYIVKSSSL